MTFNQDLTRGKETERRVVELLRSQGATDFEIPDGYFPDHDIRCSFGTYEVKEDRFNNGRVFFEHTYKGKPSGLHATKADFFVIVVSETAHILPVPALKEFLNENLRVFRRVNAGDNSDSNGFLVDTKWLSGTYVAGAKEYTLPQNKAEMRLLRAS